MPPCMLEICNSLARTTRPPMKRPRQSKRPAPLPLVSADWSVVSDAAAKWKNFRQLIEFLSHHEVCQAFQIAPVCHETEYVKAKWETFLGELINHLRS